MKTPKTQREAAPLEPPGKIAGLLFVALTCLLPLFLTPRGYTTITGDKYGFLLAAVGLCGLLTLGWMVLSRRRGYRISLGIFHRPMAFRFADVAALVFLLGAVLSTLLSPDPELALFGAWQRNDGLVTQAAYVAAYFIISRFYQFRKVHFKIFAASCALICLLAVLQSLGLDPLNLFDFERYLPASGIPYTPYTMPFRSTIGNINLLSTYAAVAAMLLGLLYLYKSEGGPIWLAGACCGFYTLLMASSDSGYVGLAVALALLLPVLVDEREKLRRLCLLLFAWSCCTFVFQFHFQVYGLGQITVFKLLTGPWAALVTALGAVALGVTLAMKKHPGYPTAKTMWRIGALLLVLLLIAGFVGVEVLGRGEAGLLYEARQLLHGNWNDRFGSSRIFIWKRAVLALRDRPLLGTGPDTFFLALDPWQEEAFQVTGIYYDKAHNEYLQILVCQGIVGLTCWLAFLGACAVGTWRGIREKPWLVPFAGGALAYLIQAFFNISVPMTAPLLWVLLGILSGRMWEMDGVSGEIPV